MAVGKGVKKGIYFIYSNFKYILIFIELESACDKVLRIIPRFRLSDILLVPRVSDNRESIVFVEARIIFSNKK